MKKLLWYVFGGWILWRLFGPEFAPRTTTRQEHPARIPGRTIFVGEREFMVRETGRLDGPVLFLLHGWGYDSVATWHRVLPTLREHFRVILMDQRNHGGTPRQSGSFSIEDLADDAAAVMTALDLPPVAVAGYSMGGMVAQALARRHPGMVSQLILAGTAAHPIAQRRAATRAMFAAGRGIGRLSLIEWARSTHRYLLRHGAVEPRHSRWLWETLVSRDPKVGFESGVAVWHFDARDWAGGLDIPTLVIIPTADQLVLPDQQRELAELLPQARVVELGGAKHEAVLTHGDEIAKAMIEFAG